MPYQVPANFGPYGNLGTIAMPGSGEAPIPIQGESGMPPVVIGAGIAAAASLAAAKMGSNASSKALKSQDAATAEAMKFSREQEAQRKAVYEQKMAQWTASRNALLQRYGIDIAPPSAAGPAGAPQSATGVQSQGPRIAQGMPTGQTPQMPQQVSQQGILGRGDNLGSLMGGQRPDLNSWNDWRTQGLQRMG